MTEIIRTPEKMLPKSRKVSVIGLVISSMMLIGVERGVGLGVVLEVAAHAPRLDRVVVHREEHDEGQGQRAG